MSLSDLNEATEELNNCNLDSNPGEEIDIKFKEAMVQLGVDKSETIDRQLLGNFLQKSSLMMKYLRRGEGNVRQTY